MLSNESYDAMNMMISYGVYFTMLEKTITDYMLPEKKKNEDMKRKLTISKKHSTASLPGLSPSKSASVRSLNLKRQGTDRSLLDTTQGFETGFYNAFSRALSQG